MTTKTDAVREALEAFEKKMGRPVGNPDVYVVPVATMCAALQSLSTALSPTASPDATPAAKPDAPGAVTTTPPPSPQETARRIVMVVDDSRSERAMLRRAVAAAAGVTLCSHGFAGECHSCKDAELAKVRAEMAMMVPREWLESERHTRAEQAARADAAEARAKEAEREREQLRELASRKVGHASASDELLKDAERRIAELETWAAQYGVHLVPRGEDSFGNGMRTAKEQVRAILTSGREGGSGEAKT